MLILIQVIILQLYLPLEHATARRMRKRLLTIFFFSSLYLMFWSHFSWSLLLLSGLQTLLRSLWCTRGRYFYLFLIFVMLLFCIMWKDFLFKFTSSFTLLWYLYFWTAWLASKVRLELCSGEFHVQRSLLQC